jgi:serine/threonine protein kinase
MLVSQIPPGFVLGDYTILSLIGRGSYGRIYHAHNTEDFSQVALKVEVLGDRKTAIRHEIEIVRALHSRYVPQLFSYAEEGDFRFLAMELCGPSFFDFQHILPTKQFSISTVLRIGIEMLRAIEDLHNHGFLHRDIKPSNFLIRANRSCPVALIDFGLSRCYVTDTGELIPPRHSPGFVGSAKYASLNAHSGKELGRRDDLFSWFYSLVEMGLGRLPWSPIDDRHLMANMKQSIDVFVLIETMPPQFSYIFRLIRRLDKTEAPDYRLILSFLVEAMKVTNSSWDDPYEWETIDAGAISAIRLVGEGGDSAERPNVPDDLPPPVMPKKLGVSFAKSALVFPPMKMRGRALSWGPAMLSTFGGLV